MTLGGGENKCTRKQFFFFLKLNQEERSLELRICTSKYRLLSVIKLLFD